jgi:hypothetical protein
MAFLSTCNSHEEMQEGKEISFKNKKGLGV